MQVHGDDGQPDSGDEEALAICVYDETAGSTALVGTMVVPPSGSSLGKSCWRGTKVKKYRDRDQIVVMKQPADLVAALERVLDIFKSLIPERPAKLLGKAIQNVIDGFWRDRAN